MRVLYLCDVFGGGTGNHLSLLSHSAKNIQGSILSNAACRSRERPHWPFTELSKHNVFDHYPVAQLHRYHQCLHQVRSEQAEIVHSYFFWSIIYGRILKRQGHIKYLVENREDEGFSWGMHEYALLRLTAPFVDRVICVSEAVSQVVREKEKISNSKLRVVRNGVPVPGQSDPQPLREELGLPKNALIVGLVANLNRAVKGVQYFIEAASIALPQFPNAYFVIVGRGSLENELRTQAKHSSVAERILFLGHRKDMSTVYPAFDIAALTSLSEGLSITLLESMSYETPIVATAVGGNPELVVEAETGFLVPAREPAAFAERVCQLLSDAEQRKQLGLAGRARVERHFAIEHVARKYEHIYRELLED